MEEEDSEIESVDAPEEEIGPSLDEAVESAWDEHEGRDSGDETDKPRSVQSSSKSSLEITSQADVNKIASDQVPLPNSWTRDSKDEWQALPRTTQERIYQRELDRERVFTQRTMEAAELKRQYQSLDDLFQPYRDEMLSKGITAPQLVGQYMMFEKAFSENPAQVIKNLMAAKGLNFESLTNDPQEINPEIQGLKQQVQTLTQYLNQQGQSAERQAHQARSDEAYSFAHETDEQGYPLRPYFEQASETILLHAQQLAAQYPQATNREILEAAYDRAIYADPSTRPAVMDAYARQQEAKRIEEARKQSQKARRASSPIKGSPSGGAMTGSQGLTLDEAVEQAYEKHMSA